MYAKLKVTNVKFIVIQKPSPWPQQPHQKTSIHIQFNKIKTTTATRFNSGHMFAQTKRETKKIKKTNKKEEVLVLLEELIFLVL